VPRVVLGACESAQTLDVTGPLEVFSTASPFVPGVDDDISVASVGGGVNQLRAQRGVTWTALAATTGISKSTLSRLETGQRRASLELLLPLAQGERVHTRARSVHERDPQS
jgi:DNA-binding XRE family transcriptional regulator